MKIKLSRTIFFVFACFVFLVFFNGNGFAEESDYSIGPDVFIFDLSLMNRLPGGYFYPFVIENYVPDTTFLIEENNGFSLIDNPRVYFEGDSFVHFNWFYNGFNLNSSLNDGSPAVLLPFSSVTAFRLQGESPIYKDYGMNFISEIPRENFARLMVSSVYTNLGSYWATFMLQPSHPTERADRLYTERRKILDNYFIDYLWSKQFKKSSLMLSINYFNIKRQFNDFNQFDTTFEEDGNLLLFNTRFRKDLASGFYEIFGVFNLLDRSAQGAEIAWYPQETIDKKRHAFVTGVTLKKKKLDLKFSILHESEELKPYEKNFSKDLIDTDGDGFYPFDKLGTFSATTFNLNINIPIEYTLFNHQAKLNLFADGRYSHLTGKEESHDYNAITFDQNPYLVVLWNQGEDYKNSNADAKVGMHMAVDISNNLSILAKLFLQYNSLNFNNSQNNLTFLSPGFDVGILLFKNKKTKILFSYGQIPYDLRENVNLFLESQRPYGTFYWWTDGNSDLTYQPGEETRVFGYTGGRYHFVDDSIAAPLKERLLLHFSTPLSKRLVLNIKAIYKKIKNNFRVKFENVNEYGFYEPHEGYDIYFFDQPFKDYYLTNNYLEKDPFCAQIHFNIKGEKKDKWFFSFSFMAHMGMGDTLFGNGPGSNDIGILGESQANPNSWINGFGRVDGDRGFVAKSYFGFYIFKKLFMGISLKYRDGDPFAFINTLSKHDQRVLYYKTIKAENEKGVKGGPREDYIADVSVRLNYRFKLFNKEAVLSLSFFNLLDFGGELSEYVFSGGTRDAVELQIPRSLRLTLNWKF